MAVGCAIPTQHRIILSDRSPSATLEATSAGPTVHLKDDSGQAPVNPISSLMYFVRLISPEPVEMSESVGNTQQSRIVSANRHIGSETFFVTCQFEITGVGTQQNIIDQTHAIRSHGEFLSKGKTLKRKLAYINIEGAGKGSIHVEGIMSDNKPQATKFSLRFNEQGHASPVTIGLNDIRRIDGKPYAVNETVIRVNSLTFHRQEENPKMEVSVASINPKNGSEGILRDLVGRVKGAVANMFIPPISIKLEGNQAMLDFAQAIVDQRPTYTFPSAN